MLLLKHQLKMNMVFAKDFKQEESMFYLLNYFCRNNTFLKFYIFEKKVKTKRTFLLL